MPSKKVINRLTANLSRLPKNMQGIANLLLEDPDSSARANYMATLEGNTITDAQGTDVNLFTIWSMPDEIYKTSFPQSKAHGGPVKKRRGSYMGGGKVHRKMYAKGGGVRKAKRYG